MIETLLQQGESQLLEFKTSFCRETNESLVAFANSRGGGVLLGVNDQGIVVGVDLSAETIKDWLNQVKNSTYPQLMFWSNGNGHFNERHYNLSSLR